MPHHSVMTSSLLIKNMKIDKFGDFSSVDYNSKRHKFREVISLIIIIVSPGTQRVPPADTKCHPAAERKQANRAC